MSLIVETGTGVAGANSYIALAAADAHYSALDAASWGDATASRREHALMQASFYIDGYSYEGNILTHHQGLAWPRCGACDREGRLLSGLPQALRTAVLELAVLYVTAPPEALQKRVVIREKAGPISLAYSESTQQPGLVFRLLQQIGARSAGHDLVRG
ncbi:MAG: DnaT-like ssDNA-binding protein [Sneathiella sp.]